MLDPHNSKRKTAFVMAVLLTTLTVTLMAQPARAQSDRQIVANIPSGTRFLIISNGIGMFDANLEITHNGRPLPAYDPATTIGDNPAILTFTGKYYSFKAGPPQINNVNGSITIVRWQTGMALKVSFTVNPVSITLPKGGKRADLTMQFEGALRLGMVLGESVFMAGTFTIVSAPGPVPAGWPSSLGWSGREGPFPFYASRN